MKYIDTSALIDKKLIDTFICSDENLLRAAEKEGLKINNPEVEES